MGLLETIRKWIDGEGGEDPLAKVEDSARPRRVWEEFMVKLAREVEASMEAEMFTPPGGLTHIPREYIIFLSNEDDREWQGEKRKALETGLFHALSKRAKELAGKNKLAAKSITLELRIDGTLEKGEFRVQPLWDATESGNTVVLPRPGTGPLNNSYAPTELPGPAAFRDTLRPVDDEDDDALPAAPGTDSDSTVVRPRTPPPTVPVAQVQPHFAVEVWLDGVRQERFLASKPEITIGRGSRSVAVDLALKGDPEISRIHATLAGGPNPQQYWLTAKGRNTTMLNGYEMPREERVSVTPDDQIAICRYVLRVQPV